MLEHTSDGENPDFPIMENTKLRIPKTEIPNSFLARIQFDKIHILDLKTKIFFE